MAFAEDLDNIRCRAYAVEATAVKVGDDIYLTQRIFTVAFCGQAVFHQFDVVVGNTVDGLINSIDRAVTVGGFGFHILATGQLDGGGGNIIEPDRTLK